MKTNFFIRLLSDSKGGLSSKRLSGLICVIFLNITLLANSFSHGDIKPSDTLVETIGLLAFGALGLTSTEKIFGKKENKEENQES